LHHLPPASCAMRTDSEAVRFVPETLDEIQNWVAYRQGKGLAPFHEEAFAPGLAVHALGDADCHDLIGDAEFFEYCAYGGHLSLAAVDQDDIGPGWKGIAIA